ncbi:MAG TPA: RDD family protein [Bryobacteraceae bacterium]|nr:RDD family protein [Bryobacteraceae bacterium]
MHCKYCGFANGEDDHRCLRCGRRIGIAIAAPTGYAGANALAVAPAFDPNATQDVEPKQTSPADTERLQQAALFRDPNGPKVIPFDQLQRQVTGRLNVPSPPPPAPAAPAAKPAQERTQTRRPAAAPAGQASLDFVAGAPGQRTLKTDVPAQIYCEQPVATPTHRFVASAMDAAMILLGFGLFVVAGELVGASFGSGKLFWIVMGSSFALIAGFYGLVFAMTGRETAGMNWTDLQLITFDGFPVDGRTRAARVAATWLSFCSAGLGLVWAVADEENLTWHDHISKTFPTIREVPKTFVRQR